MLAGIEPVASGVVTRAGCHIGWQEFGAGEDVVLLLPTWSIVHSDFWRHQVPVLAEQYRVITFDGLGNGASDRPMDPCMYADLLVAADAVAVLDARGVARAAVAGVSRGGPWALAVAAQHPERVSAAVFIAPNVPLAPGHPERIAAGASFDEVHASYDGWLKWNRHYWLAHYEDFLRFFFAECFTEADSGAHIEHFVRMGLETTPEVLLATCGAQAKTMTTGLARQLASDMKCPSLVLHGDQDAITPLARGTELARLIDAELVVLSGSGHEPQCRIPDIVNAHLTAFFDEHRKQA